MKILDVNYTRGQLKIQQMAFVLVALMIFFALVSLFYFSIRINNLEGSASILDEQESKELVGRIASSPEFHFEIRESCSSCIDLDKVLVLKDRESYEGFWGLDYLMIERLGENLSGECSKGAFGNCQTITLIEETDFGKTESAFAALCSWDERSGGHVNCEIGKIHASGIEVEE